MDTTGYTIRPSKHFLLTWMRKWDYDIQDLRKAIQQPYKEVKIGNNKYCFCFIILDKDELPAFLLYLGIYLKFIFTDLDFLVRLLYCLPQILYIIVPFSHPCQEEVLAWPDRIASGIHTNSS